MYPFSKTEIMVPKHLSYSSGIWAHPNCHLGGLDGNSDLLSTPLVHQCNPLRSLPGTPSLRATFLYLLGYSAWQIIITEKVRLENYWIVLAARPASPFFTISVPGTAIDNWYLATIHKAKLIMNCMTENLLLYFASRIQLIGVLHAYLMQSVKLGSNTTLGWPILEIER